MRVMSARRESLDVRESPSPRPSPGVPGEGESPATSTGPAMLATVRRLATKLFSAAEMEASVLKTLHANVRAALSRLDAEDPGLKPLLRRAHGYAVFPAVGKATAVVGGAFGKGEVFERGSLIGYAAVAQLTIGVQLGGQTFTEIIVFESPEALERFKTGRVAFAANASAVLVMAGAAASARFDRGAAVLVFAEGGMMLEAAVGGQKFFYRPAVLGRAKAAPARKASGATSRARTSAKARGAGRRTARSRRAPSKSSRKPGGRTAKRSRSRA
jgi:lipid-binding SYLF domain-containing protein